MASAAAEFLAEAKELLGQLEEGLLALEAAPADARGRIDHCFRATHSLKGAAGLHGYRTLYRLAHRVETALEGLRDVGPVRRDAIDALLAGADRLRALVDDLARSDAADVSDVERRLRPFAETAGTATPRLRVLADLQEWNRTHGGLAAFFAALERHAEIIEARLEPADPPVAGAPLPYAAVVASALPAADMARLLSLAPDQVQSLDAPQAPAPIVAATPAAPAATVRLPVTLLDELMALAGELVLVRNQALATVDADDPQLRGVARRLDAVTVAMQDAVLRTRMQPVAILFNRFPRMVRDLARQLGKEIELDLSGTEVELDKTVLEALADPLGHLVRNACDHAIELPEIRRAAGKPTTGRIALSAKPLAGRIRIEVRDDGKGMDSAALARNAVASGRRTAAEVAALGERERLELAFLPGFSTAAAVTDLSGRGVGLDVAKTNLDQLGGTLTLDSQPGKGTRFALEAPLTLAIVPGLVVAVGGARYALPQKDVEEVVALHPDLPGGKVERAYDREYLRLRERLVPLVRLADVLARRTPFDPATWAEIAARPEPDSSAVRLVAVVRNGARRYGLVVDAVQASQEIVVKPLPRLLGALPCYAGATILGDGQIALILDAGGIARHSGLLAGGEERPVPVSAPKGEAQPFLVFRAGGPERFAVPLAQVRRVERFAADRLERVGDREYLAVDGVAVEALRLERLLPVAPCPPRDELLLLLPRNLARPAGLVMTDVVDTPTATATVDAGGMRRDGLVGTTVLDGRMTLLLDVHRLAERAADPPAPVTRARRRALLVEDTQFFRAVVGGFLEGDGYEVTLAENGAEGLAKLEDGPFDVVVSDVEMPVMDGWAFAAAARRRPAGARVPMLALTTLDQPEHRARSLASGFDRHETKLDRDRFLGAVRDVVAARGAEA